jgi:hypothetical protein
MGRPWREEYKGGIYHVIVRATIRSTYSRKASIKNISLSS